MLNGEGLDAAVLQVRGEEISLLYEDLRHTPPRGYRRLTIVEARHRLREWFPLAWWNEYFVRRDLTDLYVAVTGYDEDLGHLTSEWLLEWAAEAIEGGRVACYVTAEWRPYRDEETYAEYAREMGIATGTPIVSKTAVQAPETGRSPHVYAGTGEQVGWANELSDSCPTPWHRSERYESATTDVRSWLDTYGRPGLFAKNALLGGEGGGGFYLNTTRIRKIQPGMRLYRFFGTCITKDGDMKAAADGLWWTEYLYDGDPRAWAALPPESSAEKMVMGEIVRSMDALTGLGAPRCTNKPGGPIQLCLPYKEAIELHGLRLL